MSYRPSTADGSSAAETTGGYFASLASARYLLLTTFKPDGTHVSAPVPGMADGGRAYFRARSRSGTVQRLQHTCGVHVAPCSVLGMLSYAPALQATARLLSGEEATWVAEELARKYPRHNRLAIPPVWPWPGRMVYYELLAPPRRAARPSFPGASGDPDTEGDQDRGAARSPAGIRIRQAEGRLPGAHVHRGQAGPTACPVPAGGPDVTVRGADRGR